MTQPNQPTVLAALRALVPDRPLTDRESLRIAEHQAGRLLELCGITEPPIPDFIISEMPRIRVTKVAGLPSSGLTLWDRSAWRVSLNADEAGVRQRFSLFHEFKHILDHPAISQLYSGSDDPGRVAERVCDYFAACVLMPRSWVKTAYFNLGIQEISALAKRFGVSRLAMTVRLDQLGLSEPTLRCGYYQRLSSRLATVSTEIAA